MIYTETSTLQIDRADISCTRWHASPHVPLEPGQVRLQIEHFGLSANNVTYATLGDAMGYWNFFPQDDAEWGCVPVWGYAAVAESRCDEVPEGGRVFGFLPFATDVVMAPVKAKDGGFVDGADHRAALPAAYNSYTPAPTATEQNREREAYNALLRPLFTTAYLIAEWLAQENFYGAETVLVSSASSKTAAATAYALGRVVTETGPKIIGLTSPAHVTTTAALGLYDDVRSYDQIDTLDADQTTVYVDLSGSASIRAAVHARCSELRYDSAVGFTHWDAAGQTESLPGPEPVFFFAPDELDRQIARVGADELFGRIESAMNDFVGTVSSPPNPLMSVTWHRGQEAADQVYQEIVTGRTDPTHAAMVSL